MSTNSTDMGEPATFAQGDLRLLDSDIAKRLLTSSVPARLAYTSTDGTPRVVPTWFHWTGEELVMPTFVAAPHVSGPARRLGALRANPAVAIAIDTETFPHDVLLIRGRASVTEFAGVLPEHAAAARRYMGEHAAGDYLAQLDQPGTRMARIAVRPDWVGALDFRTRFPGGLTPP